MIEKMIIYYLKKVSLEDSRFIKQISKGDRKNIHMLKKFRGCCYLLLSKNKMNGIYKSYSDIYNKERLFNYKQCFNDYCEYYCHNRFEFLQCTPMHILKFYHYYVVKLIEFPDEWFRGELINGNILLEVSAERLDNIIDSL